MADIIKKMKTSELAMKVREKFFLNNRYSPATYAHFVQAMKRYKECTNLKKTSQIKREIQVCRKYWNCYPYHYFIYNLFRADNDISDEELINYIPHFYWYKLLLPHYSSHKFSLIGENKIVIEQVFTALAIIQPKTLCILMGGNPYSPDMNLLSYTQIWDDIQRENDEKLFVKPADGSGGRGIYVFHKTDRDCYVTSDNIKFDANFLATIGKNNDYIIQAGVSQASEISEIYPDSVNTCRIITENKNGMPRIVCAMLRIGRGQKEIDNISSGGICVNINTASGNFGDFAISYEGEKFANHPDTQFGFRNKKIARWEEIQKFTAESAGKLPFFTYLGWDIALTSEGPVAIEINTAPAIDIIEMTSRGLRKAFRIEDPDYYWKNLGKRV